MEKTFIFLFLKIATGKLLEAVEMIIPRLVPAKNKRTRMRMPLKSISELFVLLRKCQLTQHVNRLWIIMQ